MASRKTFSIWSPDFGDFAANRAGVETVTRTVIRIPRPTRNLKDKLFVCIAFMMETSLWFVVAQYISGVNSALNAVMRSVFAAQRPGIAAAPQVAKARTAVVA